MQLRARVREGSAATCSHGAVAPAAATPRDRGRPERGRSIHDAQAGAKAIMLVASAFGRSPRRVRPSTM
jgi:hypothetical protein